MLYTRTGDNGASGLFGTKERFPKTHPVYEALGTLDELNSLMGLCRARMERDSAAGILYAAQQRLFTMQAELAGAPHALGQPDVDDTERAIGELEGRMATPQGFVVPGSCEKEALLDYARAVARRAERRVLGSGRPLSEASLRWINRLSSLLYALARAAASGAGASEPAPLYRRADGDSYSISHT